MGLVTAEPRGRTRWRIALFAQAFQSSPVDKGKPGLAWGRAAQAVSPRTPNHLRIKLPAAPRVPWFLMWLFNGKVSSARAANGDVRARRSNGSSPSPRRGVQRPETKPVSRLFGGIQAAEEGTIKGRDFDRRRLAPL